MDRLLGPVRQIGGRKPLSTTWPGNLLKNLIPSTGCGGICLLPGVDSDNGSEFINQCFLDYCRDNRITFTMSRSYQKNDSRHAEQ